MSDPRTSERLRDRRRAETVADIKAAALDRVATQGYEAMSLRAVARDVGVSVQALYHYFPSRDALVTNLIVDCYTDLTAAVRAASGRAGIPSRERVVAAGLAYRRWALEHRSAFQLTLGVPLSNYAAPVEGPTTVAASQLGETFRDVIFSEWTTEQLDALQIPGEPGVSTSRLAAALAGPVLSPGALAYFTSGWATLHGLVTLELLGHLVWVGDAGEDLLRATLMGYVETLYRHRSPGPEPD